MQPCAMVALGRMGRLGDKFMTMRKEVRIVKLEPDGDFPERVYKISTFYADGAEADWDYARDADEAGDVAVSMLEDL